MQRAVPRNALSWNTDLQTGQERPSDSGLQGRGAAVARFWKDSGLLGALVQGGSRILEDTRPESSGEEGFHHPCPCLGVLFSPPQIPILGPHTHVPRARILWKLHAERPDILLFLAQKLLGSALTGK